MDYRSILVDVFAALGALIAILITAGFVTTVFALVLGDKGSYR